MNGSLCEYTDLASLRAFDALLHRVQSTAALLYNAISIYLSSDVGSIFFVAIGLLDAVQKYISNYGHVRVYDG